MLDSPTSRLQSAASSASDLFDGLVRAASVLLLALLILAYATGEEYQETHLLVAYAGAALVITALYWELVRPHEARFKDYLFSWRAVQAIGSAWKGMNIGASSAATLTGIALLLLMAMLASAALAMIALTHSFWPAAAVDEMHEVVAYLALGLVVFYLVIVLVNSSEHLERRLRGGRRP